MVYKTKKKHYIFIDESGTSDVKNFKYSPVFTVMGVVISDHTRESFNLDFQKLSDI